MHIIPSCWKPKYLLGLSINVQLPSRARREVGKDERLHRIESACSTEWLMTAKSINWMSGQLLHGLSFTAMIKQSAHYVIKWVKNELSTWRLSKDTGCTHCFTSLRATEAPLRSAAARTDTEAPEDAFALPPRRIQSSINISVCLCLAVSLYWPCSGYLIFSFSCLSSHNATAPSLQELCVLFRVDFPKFVLSKRKKNHK